MGRIPTKRKGICASFTQHRGKLPLGLNRMWDLQMRVTPSAARMIQDVDLALKALEISYDANGATVEGLADRY